MNRHARRVARVEARVEKKPPPSKQRVRLAVLKVHAEIDKIADGLSAKFPISCKKGCSACCRMPVDSSVQEALLIVDRFPDVVRDVLPEIEAQGDFFDKLCDEQADWTSLEGQHAIASAWWKEDRRCAFLRDGLCSIYEARPLACRNYHVVSDPAKCGAEGGTIVDIVLAVSREVLYPTFARNMPNGEINLGYLPTTVRAALLRK